MKYWVGVTDNSWFSFLSRLRPDEVTEQDQRERFQDEAPSKDQGLYLVPKVIE